MAGSGGLHVGALRRPAQRPPVALLTPMRSFAIVLAVVVAIMVGFGTTQLDQHYVANMRAAERQTAAAAAVTADALGRTLLGIDMLLGAPALASVDATAPIASRDLLNRIVDMPQLRALLIVDADGKVVSASSPSLVGQMLKQPAWLATLQQSPERHLLGPRGVIDTGAADAARLLPIGRAWHTGNDNGAVVVLLDPDYLDWTARQIAGSFGLDIRVYDRAMVLLAGSAPAATADRDHPAGVEDQPWFAPFLPTLASGSWHGEAKTGEDVIAAFAAPLHLPFVVTATMPTEAALVSFHRSALVQAARFGVFALLALVGLWLMHRQEEALRRQRARLADSERAVQAANNDRQEFLATVGREIRMPVSGMISVTGLLLETRLDDEQHRYVQAIHSSAEQLQTVLDDILHLSDPGGPAIRLEPAPFTIEEEVATITELFSPAAAAKGVELVCRFAVSVPASMVGDAGRFRQILFNLVANAVKFTERGWIEITCAASARDAAHVALECTVADTGVGIDPHRLPLLFEQFAQTAAPGKLPPSGGGFGLAISRRLVQAMGGSISAASRPGGGSEFHFSVVLRRLAGAPVAAAPVHRRRRCLVVDDVPLCRDVLVADLTALGAGASAAEDGVAALGMMRAAAAAGAPYDTVLIDRNMPVMDGISLARAIRGDAQLGRSAVRPRLLLCTPGPLRASAMAMHDSDLFDAQLAKPVLPTRLGTVLALLGAPPLVAATTAAAVPRRAANAAAEGVAAPPGLAGLHILLADDNNTNQLVTRSILERAGAQVDVVGDGAAAVAAVHDGAYDVVLMDVQMPGMDGLAATRAIRAAATPDAPRLRIVGLTAEVGADFERRCEEAGMDAMVSKPIARARLIDAVAGAAQPAAADASA